MTRVFFVYIDWTTEAIPRVFYVGKGDKARVNKRDRNNHWKHIAKKHGWRREVVLGTKDEACAFDEEKRLIKEHRTFCGYDDYVWGANKTAGGEGVTGAKHTEEWLDLYARGPNNPNYGKTGGKWWLHGKSNPMLGHKHSNEANEKNRQAHLGKRHAAATIVKISGENHPRAKLTRATVDLIRARYMSTSHLAERHPDKISCVMLAKEHNVTVGSIIGIINYRTWK